MELLGVDVQRGFFHCAGDEFGGLWMLLVGGHGRYGRSGRAVIHDRLGILDCRTAGYLLAHSSDLLALTNLVVHLLW